MSARRMSFVATRWWQVFWLAWAIVFGTFDIVVGSWPYAIGLALVTAICLFVSECSRRSHFKHQRRMAESGRLWTELMAEFDRQSSR